MKGEFIVDKSGDRLDKFLLEKLPELSRARIKTLVDLGEVLLNGKKVKAGEIVKVGQVVTYDYQEEQPLNVEAEEVDFEIVYEDSDILVINKPQGLVVHPCSSTKSGTLVNGLLYQIKDLSGINGVLRPGIVHRLDKNTSGLMIVAKNDKAHSRLAEDLKNKTTFKRKYLALCEGHFKENEGKIESFIERDKKDRKKMTFSLKSGKFAVTNYCVVERYQDYDLVEFALETGRTHQIRVHCKMKGHPVVGDDVYGHSVKGLVGQLLHSYKLEFIHPCTNLQMSFEIGLPEHFKNFLDKIQ